VLGSNGPTSQLPVGSCQPRLACQSIHLLHSADPDRHAGLNAARLHRARAPIRCAGHVLSKRATAAVAVRTLCEHAHSGAEYVLTGPQSLSQFAQIATIGSVLGRALRTEEISAEDWFRELPSSLPAFVANYLLDAGLPQSGNLLSLRPQSPNSPDRRHEPSWSGPLITLRSSGRDMASSR
jgi:hypothetical protein